MNVDLLSFAESEWSDDRWLQRAFYTAALVALNAKAEARDRDYAAKYDEPDDDETEEWQPKE